MICLCYIYTNRIFNIQYRHFFTRYVLISFTNYKSSVVTRLKGTKKLVKMKIGPLLYSSTLYLTLGILLFLTNESGGTDGGVLKVWNVVLKNPKLIYRYVIYIYLYVVFCSYIALTTWTVWINILAMMLHFIPAVIWTMDRMRTWRCTAGAAHIPVITTKTTVKT